MIKGFYIPSPKIIKYIDRYWFWESEINEVVTLPKIVPATGTEFIFHYNNPFKDYPDSHILCSREKGHYNFKQNGRIGFISVRFKSWAFKYFSKVPTYHISNMALSASDIWGNNGKILEEKVSLSSNNLERVEILNNFFEEIVENGFKVNPGIDWAVDYIYYNLNQLSINDVIYRSNLSSRTFQRNFKESVGISAKHFHKVSRFQTILKSSLLNNSLPTIDDILEIGYFDQSHFNKDFKLLTGENPTSLIRYTNMAHFYNKSLR